MRSSRTLGFTSLVLATCLALTACGGSSDDNGGTVATPTSRPATTQQPTSDSKLPNKDPKLFAAATPCLLVTSADLTKLFKGSFSNVLGTDDSPVTDRTEMKRACGYSSEDAQIDHGDSYDITMVSFTVTTSLDDEDGTLWQAYQEAMKVTGGQHAAMPGADDLIRLGKGWYQARKGQVIVEIDDISSELTDEGAKSILTVALSRLP